MHCACCIEIHHFVNVAKHACDQCSIFRILCHDYGLLLELHTLTLVAHSYALLLLVMTLCSIMIMKVMLAGCVAAHE